MQNNLNLTHQQISDNIKALQDLMQQEGLDGFYISSFDKFISEYNPLEDCHRYYLTGFTGSMADVLVLPDKVKLYVDGRYWEQAENEINSSDVEVVRCTKHNMIELLDSVKTLGLKNLGIESQRTPYSFGRKLEAVTNVKHLSTDDLLKAIGFTGYTSSNPIEFLPREFRGSDVSEKISKIIKSENEAYFITAVDGVSWITNCRGYHLPNQSSFMGRAFITHDKVYVFIDEGINVAQNAKDQSELEFIHTTESQLQVKLNEIQSKYNLSQVRIDCEQLNSSDYLMLVNVFTDSKLEQTDGGIIPVQCIKDAGEIAEIERSFDKGNKAIFNTIKWVKENLAAGKKVTEYDIYTQTSKEYEKQGSKSQSFNTIAGLGANSSIIHFSSPSNESVVKPSDFVLLDSGGYFDGGFATDTTRTFLVDDSLTPDKKFVKMYTLVLKGLLNLQNSIFPEGVAGSVIDGFARHALYQEGMDYKHGTGHGVGIHVHESGVRISTVSQVPMKAGQLVSLEPGCYEPGFGGVRLENIALVEEHPDKKGFLRFKNFVWIGFEPELIDDSMLSEQEKHWLEIYEGECERRGHIFR